MKKLLFLSMVLCGLLQHASAQHKKMTVGEYIEKYWQIAQDEMRRTGIPASITLAQGIVESEHGNGVLVGKSNNHFGIKCPTCKKGEYVLHNDDKKNERFRKYRNSEESYEDHSNFLLKPRYAALFKIPASNYEGWAYGLKKAGYATNKKYPKLLIKYIKEYNLDQYDSIPEDTIIPIKVEIDIETSVPPLGLFLFQKSRVRYKHERHDIWKNNTRRNSCNKSV